MTIRKVANSDLFERLQAKSWSEILQTKYRQPAAEAIFPICHKSDPPKVGQKMVCPNLAENVIFEGYSEDNLAMVGQTDTKHSYEVTSAQSDKKNQTLQNLFNRNNCWSALS